MGTLISQFPGRVLTPVALEITEHDFKGMQTYEPDTTVWGIGSKQLQEAVVNSFLVPSFMRSCNHFLLVEVQWPEEGLNSSTTSARCGAGQPSRLCPSPAFHYPAFDHRIERGGLGTFIMAKSRQKGVSKHWSSECLWSKELATHCSELIHRYIYWLREWEINPR